MSFLKALCEAEEMGNDRPAARLRFATLGNRELTIRSVATEGKALGDCRYSWERRAAADGSCAAWCKDLVDVRLHDSRVTEGKVFRRVSKKGTRNDASVTADVVWYAVKRYARQIGLGHFGTSRSSPHLRPPLPRGRRRTRTDPVSPWSRICANEKRSTIDFESQSQTTQQAKARNAAR
jgi:hypothetical protein